SALYVRRVHHRPVAISHQHGGKRYVHVEVCVANAKSLRCLRRQRSVRKHTDDSQPGVANLDGATDCDFGREKACLDTIADDGNGPCEVVMLLIEHSPCSQFEIDKAEIRCIDADYLARASPSLTRNERVEYHLAGCGLHLGDESPNARCILHGETGRI